VGQKAEELMLGETRWLRLPFEPEELMSDQNDHTEDYAPPPAPPVDPSWHDPAEPVPAPPVEVLTPEKAARLAELRRMAAIAPLNEEAVAELAALEKSPLPPGPDEKEAVRLQGLRAAEVKGQITDADKAELDALALKEADAAGHPRPEDIKPVIIDPVHGIIGEVVAMLESMVDTVPALGGLRASIYRLKAAHARLTEPKP
jgi:hypothetical protein